MKRQNFIKFFRMECRAYWSKLPNLQFNMRLEVVAEGGRPCTHSSLCDLLLHRPDDCGVDVRADGLVSEIVGHIIDGDRSSVGCGVGVGTLYGDAFHRRPRVLEHTNLVTLAAVAAHVAAIRINAVFLHQNLLWLIEPLLSCDSLNTDSLWTTAR